MYKGLKETFDGRFLPHKYNRKLNIWHKLSLNPNINLRFARPPMNRESIESDFPLPNTYLKVFPSPKYQHHEHDEGTSTSSVIVREAFTFTNRYWQNSVSH